MFTEYQLCAKLYAIHFICIVMDWMSVSSRPPNSYIEALTSNVMVFEGGDFRRYEVMRVESSWWDY